MRAATLSGMVTLTGPGDHVVDITGALVTLARASVVLAGGAEAASAVWSADTISLGNGSDLAGLFLAEDSIDVGSGTTITGKPQPDRHRGFHGRGQLGGERRRLSPLGAGDTGSPCPPAGRPCLRAVIGQSLGLSVAFTDSEGQVVGAQRLDAPPGLAGPAAATATPTATLEQVFTPQEDQAGHGRRHRLPGHRRLRRPRRSPGPPGSGCAGATSGSAQKARSRSWDGAGSGSPTTSGPE